MSPATPKLKQNNKFHTLRNLYTCTDMHRNFTQELGGWQFRIAQASASSFHHTTLRHPYRSLDTNRPFNWSNDLSDRLYISYYKEKIQKYSCIKANDILKKESADFTNSKYESNFMINYNWTISICILSKVFKCSYHIVHRPYYFPYIRSKYKAIGD